MSSNKMITALVLAIIVTAAIPLHAVKDVDMPEDFGSEAWAVSHWSEAVDYLHYLAGDDTRQEFVNLSETQRLEAWQSFWAGVDESNRTLEHESREQYFQRIKYANENFGTILQPGWKTEMGETWIRLGQPDWRDRYAMRSGGRDLEVWNYMDSRDAYLVFMDRTGLGDYDLLNYGAMLDQVYFF